MHNRISHSWVRQAAGDAHRIEAFFTGAAFAPHRHDTYAIGVTLEGVQSFDYRGKARHAHPGDLVVLHPDELHDGRAGTDAGFRYRTIYIAPERIQSALNGKPLPYIAGGVSSDERLRKTVLPLLEDYDCPLARPEYDDALYDLAVALNDVSGAYRSNGRTDYRAAETARQFIHEHLEEGVTLERLEATTGRDRWELSRDFRTLFGTSPYRYLIMRRLDKAQEMLLSGFPVSRTALICGFSDQSHFTRHFKKTYGMTPKKWLSAMGRA